MPDVLDMFGLRLQPLASGGLWIPAASTLVVADLHLEKASAFAVRGMMLPPYDSCATLDALAHDLDLTAAQTLYCLGDSFHDPGAFMRLDGETRLRLRRMTRSVEWTWITGNHDPAVDPELGGHSASAAAVGPFTLRHEALPAAAMPELSGHFHPKLRLHAKGRSISRRCLAVSAQRIILPAYGALTGGLDVWDTAIRRVMGRCYEAVVVSGERLLRFPASTAYSGAELA